MFSYSTFYTNNNHNHPTILSQATAFLLTIVYLDELSAVNTVGQGCFYFPYPL
jgi:hypothetical protein